MRAFRRSLRDLPPLTLSPAEINQYLHRREQVDRAMRLGTTRLSYDLIPVDTDPGVEAPVLPMNLGTAVAILFVDSTGSPWPVTSVTTGNARWFHVAAPKGLKNGNMLVGSALVRVGQTNIIVSLAGRNGPVSMVLRARPTPASGGKTLPTVVTVMVPGLGPQAKPPAFSPSGTHTVNARQVAFLDGVPPKGAHALVVSPAGRVQAWVYHRRIYLRTHASLVFPAWTAVLRNRHLRVYTIPLTPSVLLDRHGRETDVTLSGDHLHG